MNSHIKRLLVNVRELNQPIQLRVGDVVIVGPILYYFADVFANGHIRFVVIAASAAASHIGEDVCPPVS
jgi:hypothetical protein